jgi:hypothetical protein
MNDNSKFLLTIALLIFGFVFGPLIFIWAVNTLFTLTIEYTLLNWFAALLLGGIVSARKN